MALSSLPLLALLLVVTGLGLISLHVLLTIHVPVGVRWVVAQVRRVWHWVTSQRGGRGGLYSREEYEYEGVRRYE